MRPYLEAHPPSRAQGYTPRRPAFNHVPGRPSGGIAVHTFEYPTDVTPPDTSAERGAEIIRRRTDKAGSYHVLFDSDSTVELWDAERTEAFHDGTGTNRHSTGISFMTSASSWGKNPRWDGQAIDQAARWLAGDFIPMMNKLGVAVPLHKVPVDSFRKGAPGFVGHGDLDPGRRSDPGDKFPWDLLFQRTSDYLNPIDSSTQKETEMIMIRNADKKHAMFGAVFWLVDGTPVGQLFNKYNQAGLQTINLTNGKQWADERKSRIKADPS